MKRFAGLALIAGTLIGAGTLSAATRRDPYCEVPLVNEHRVVITRPVPVRIVRERQRDFRRDSRDIRRDSRDFRHDWR